MKYFSFLCVALASAFLQTEMANALVLEDDFSSLRCEMLKGNDDPAVGKALLENGTVRLTGSCQRKITPQSLFNSAFTSELSFYIPAGSQQNWDSAALTFYGKNPNSRIYFMVIYGQPGQKGDQRRIGLYENQMVTKDLPGGFWYTLKTSIRGGEGYLKVWRKDQNEPEGWDVALSIPSYFTTVHGVGMRTFGKAVQYDDLRFSSRALQPLTVQQQGVEMTFSPFGTLQSLKLRPDGEKIQFRKGGFYAGPAWIIGGRRVALAKEKGKDLIFRGKRGDLALGLSYTVKSGALEVQATIKNEGKNLYAPEAARLMLGVDTEMISYPEWNEKFFPTLLRAEKTHFWGYLMSPKGRILTLLSPDPIASWNYEYQPNEHRIYTVSLDILHTLPLPKRHPQDLTLLQPGEELTRRFVLQELDDVKAIKPVAATVTGAPMVDADRYTLADDQESHISIFSRENINLVIEDPQGRVKMAKLSGTSADGCFRTVFRPAKGALGLYTLRAFNSSGKVTEASIYVRHPWSWYLKQARKEAVRIPQKASTHTEAWLGHYSAVLARRYFPDPELDAAAEKNFRIILPKMYNLKTGAQIVHSGRIQNAYYMFGLLADYYRVNGDEKDLLAASKIADWLMKFQTPDGAYRNGNTHYTCVAYGAKSMLELAATEKLLAAKDPEWKKRYERHFRSAQRAVDELCKNLDNIGTEGQATYEDGMISCSATQLALFALIQKDPEKRAKLQKAAQFMFNGHRCLDQMIVPDCRYNEGTLRFWEVQYDIMVFQNMMNSPHGWTAWRIPGYYYMYQLTGDEEWLRRAMNSLGSCVQLIDGKTGVLRHSFSQDPFIRTSQLIEDKKNPANNGGVRVPVIVGESYHDMISHFYKPKDPSIVCGGHWGEAGCCDNDVHEVFKALEEVALTAAYVIERADGTLSTYNCTAQNKNGTIMIVPSEKVVSRVHLNLRKDNKIEVHFGSGAVFSESCGKGMRWVGPGGVPEDLR